MSTLVLPISEIVAAYKAGDSLAVIARRFDCSPWTIKHRLLQAGENLRRRGPSRTYTLNEEFFDEISTESQAYWLGFLLADARVARLPSGSWRCRTDLAVVDRDHLVKLAAAVQSDAPIKPGHDGESVYLDLCSVKLCKQLVTLDCGPDKTGKHGTPLIPACLQHHFYRGFSDGDGSIYEIPSIHSWRFDAVGSPKFIHELQTWLMTHAKLRRTKLITPKNSPTSRSVRYTGGKQVERICRVLYADATVWLPRKYKQFQLQLLRNK